MAFVSPLQGHIDVALSNFAVKFRNPGYVSDQVFQVFTRVPVQRQSDKYWRFGREQLQALIDDLRAPGAAAQRVSQSLSADTYFAEDHALEISDEPDGSRQVVALEYSPTIFVDTAGPQQQLVQCPEPGGGFAPNATRLSNVLQNGSFFRSGISGQEGTSRPRYWKEYSNTGATPAVPGEVEHLLADDRVHLKTKTASVDKIGLRSLWKNLGRLFKPGQFVALAVSLRHTGASGTYDKVVKLKLDSTAQDYTRSDGTKFDATIPAGSVGNTFIIRHVVFQLRADQAVPDALNVFVWSEATAAAPSNEDLEVDFITLAAGRLWQPYDPLSEIRDADVTWDGVAALYALPAHLTKESAPTQDSGGAGLGSGGVGSGGDDFEDGLLRPFNFL